MLGLMMKTPLLLSSILQHAARSFPDVEIVSRIADKPDHRTNYLGLLRRTSRLSNALTELGVLNGELLSEYLGVLTTKKITNWNGLTSPLDHCL